MTALRKTFALILCLTVMVVFANPASGDSVVKIDNKTNKKECTKDDPSPECAGAKVQKTDEVKTFDISDGDQKSETDECTHGLTTNCIDTFHAAMAPCCHDLIPQGKYDEARAAVPKMSAACKEIAQYNPGDTYGKSLLGNFETKRTAFLASMTELEAAASNPDNEAFKAAFDKMHGAFEQMNSVLSMRPEGIEEFHNVMAPIWHDYLPAQKYAEIKGAMPQLLKAAEQLTRVRLDEQMMDKQETFSNNAQKIFKCCQDLAKASDNNDAEKISESAQAVHESYEKLISNM